MLEQDVENIVDTYKNVINTYTYDQLGNVLNNGTLTYVYDSFSRLIEKSDSDTNITQKYEYDSMGNRTKLEIFEGTSSTPTSTTTYEFDRLNRLTKVYENGTLITEYSYDINGNRDTETDYLNASDEVTTSYTYNIANMLETMTNKKNTITISSYSYEYMLDGNKVKETDHTSEITTYIYDYAGRLLEEEDSSIKYVYTYDDYGNRQALTETDKVSGNTITKTYVYDLANRLVSETKTENGTDYVTIYTYDDNGNQITVTDSSNNVTNRKYDGLNRLIEVTEGTNTYTYDYFQGELRKSKTINGTTTKFVLDSGYVILELDGSNNIQSEYAYGLNLIKSDDSFYVNNGHGDVVQLISFVGVITKEYEYTAFGIEINEDSTDTNPFRYTGEYWDEETKTYYLRARYYNPNIGRFISEDNYRGMYIDSLSLNLYTYCVNNPIFYIDPSGHMMTKPLSIMDLGNKDVTVYEDTGVNYIPIKGTSDVDMQVSQEYIDFLKQYETFEPEAYRGQDSQNQTIGYGHVILPDESFGTLTVTEAEELLKSDLQSRVDYVNQQAEKYGLELNQHEFDGLVDMVFNKGNILTPDSATFFKLIVEDSDDTDEIFYQFSRWNKVNGEFSLGVYRYSTDSADIFLNGDYTRDYRDTPDEYK